LIDEFYAWMEQLDPRGIAFLAKPNGGADSGPEGPCVVNIQRTRRDLISVSVNVGFPCGLILLLE
jgi:hypothetical protein